MILVSHPTGNQFVRALVSESAARGKLAAYCTTFSLGRRSMGLPGRLIRAWPWRETGRLLCQRAGWRWPIRHEAGVFSIDAVYRSLDRRVAGQLDGVDAVYAYEDGARETFKAAKSRGIRCCYDLPIAYHEFTRSILEEEAQRLPEWEPTLVATRDSSAKLQRKREELALADFVVCPSEFVRRTLPAATRGVVSEFGSPAVRSLGAERGGPLRVLFAGSLTQRKGLADVFAAVRLLNTQALQLVVAGAPVVEFEFYRRNGPSFEYHPPCDHEEMLRIMSGCDVLVLPSLVEGRALVQQEAMVCGLPLIVTPNTGGEDLITPETGRLVPIRSPESIAESVQWFLDHRELLPDMRRAAQRKVAMYSWEAYARKILDAVDGSL